MKGHQVCVDSSNFKEELTCQVTVCDENLLLPKHVNCQTATNLQEKPIVVCIYIVTFSQ